MVLYSRRVRIANALTRILPNRPDFSSGLTKREKANGRLGGESILSRSVGLWQADAGPPMDSIGGFPENIAGAVVPPRAWGI